MKKLILFIIPIILISLVSALTWDGISYWDLNENAGNNAKDIEYGKNNMSLTDVGELSWGNAKLGSSAILFNGNGYLNASDSNSLNLTNGSISMWVNRSFANGTAYYLFRKGLYSDNDNTHQFTCRWDSTNNFYCTIGTGGGSVGLTGVSAITPHKYHHLVFTWNSSSLVLYIDGIHDATQTHSALPISSTGELSFGYGRSATSTLNWTGSMDEIGLWNRSLTSVEVGELYNSGSGIMNPKSATTSSIVTTLITPTNDEALFNNPITFNASIYPVSLNLTNATLYIWKSGTIFNQTTNAISSESTNSTTWEIYFSEGDTYTWNVYGCGINNTSGSYCSWGTSNYSFYYNNISVTKFGLCNSTLNVPYLNLTFQDESDSSTINASISSATFWLWYGNTNNNITYTFSNSTEHFSYAFCYDPAYKGLNASYSVDYKSTGFPQRTYNSGITNLSNSTTNTVLQLLGTSDGIYVTFQVVNSAEQPVSDVSVNATRKIGGVTTLVGSGETGDDGGITFWLNPDYYHTFTFIKSGYDTYTTSLYPTQSSYTINLGGSSASEYNDYLRGILYRISPTNDTLYVNRTSGLPTFTFTLNLTSDYWTVTEWGFYLKNSTYNILDYSTSTNNGGGLSNTINVGNYSNIIMEYYWVINGNYTNGTRFYAILSVEGTDWSIKNFFTSIKSYLTQDIFGLDNFGLAIIIFLFIFVFTGIMSYKFGVTSPAAISALVFSLVLFLDVGLGLLDSLNPVERIPHFPSFAFGLIMIILIIREGLR